MKFTLTFFLALFISVSAFSQERESSLAAFDSELAPLEVLDQGEGLKAFAAEGENYFGVLADTAPWLAGSPRDLASPAYEEIRDRLKSLPALSFQSEERMTTKNEGSIVVVRSRLLVKSATTLLAINEEHRIAPDKSSYTLFMISELSNETKALRMRDRIAEQFAATRKSSARHQRQWFRLLVEKSWAQESARARGTAGNRPRTSATTSPVDPRCANIGIRDPNARRRLNEPPLSIGTGVLSCGRGVWDAATGIVAAFTGPSTTLTSLGVGPMGQLMIQGSMPMQYAGLRMAEGIVGLVGAVATTVAEKRGRVFQYAWSQAVASNSRFRCMTNAAQMRIVCDVIANVVTMVVPVGAVAGTAARAARLGSAASRGARAGEINAAITNAARTRVAQAVDAVPPPPTAPRAATQSAGAPPLREPVMPREPVPSRPRAAPTSAQGTGEALGRSNRFAFYNRQTGRQALGPRTLTPGKSYTTVERNGTVIIGEDFAENGVTSGTHVAMGEMVARDFPVTPSEFARTNLRGGAVRVNPDGSVDVSGYHNGGMNPRQSTAAAEEMSAAFREAGVPVRVSTPDRLPPPVEVPRIPASPSTPQAVQANPSAFQRLGTRSQGTVEQATSSGRLRMVRLEPVEGGPPRAVDIPPEIVPGRYYVAVELPNRQGLAITEYNSLHGGHTALAR
ncbi:MAG: hypothetical protein V4760_09070, partial [Bdellovibrionota bacterium]